MDSTEELYKQSEIILKDKLRALHILQKDTIQVSIPMKIPTQEEIDSARKSLADCYYRIINIQKRYLDLPEDYYKFQAIWILGTYFHEEFNSFPYLYLNAMRGSGKTRNLKLISSLGCKGDGSVQTNPTEAVLYRIPRGKTSCFDEMEQVGSKDKQAMRQILNSSYKKGTKVSRVIKKKVGNEEKQVIEELEPYFPIAIANIWGIEEVLGDRSVSLILEKSSNPLVTKKIEDFDTNPEIKEIKRTLEQVSVVSAVSLRQKRYIEHWNDYIEHKYRYTTTLTTTTTLNNTTTLLNGDILSFFNRIDDTGIFGRNFELLFPLLLVANEIGKEVFDEVLRIGSELTLKKREDEYSESKDVCLFEFIASDPIVSFGFNFVPIKELTQKFRIFLGDVEDRDDIWLNNKWLGKALKRLNLILNKKRVASGNLVMLDYAKAKEKLKIFKQDKEVLD